MSSNIFGGVRPKIYIKQESDGRNRGGSQSKNRCSLLAEWVLFDSIGVGIDAKLRNTKDETRNFEKVAG